MRQLLMRYGFAIVMLGGHGALSSQSPLQTTSFYTTNPQAPIGSRGHPARLSSGVVAGNTLQQPKPVFPPVTQGTHTSGATVMHVLINPEGRVEKIDPISGPESVRERIEDTVKRWTYKPFVQDGKAIWVESIVTLIVDFGA